ncbi:MAG TPA: glycosyltransferase family 4 protein [Ilumatobacteraceae bacterium]
MNVLILTEYLPRSEDAEITGGVEAYCHYVPAHLRREHDVTVIGRSTDGSVWDAAHVGSLPGRLWFLARALVRGLKSPGDVVVGTTYVVQPIAWLIAKVRRRPIVFWYPDVLIGRWRGGEFGRVGGLIGETVERILLKLPIDRYIAISESTASKLVANGVDPERVVVIPCGYEQHVVDAVEPQPYAVPTLVVVGRLVNYKRVDLVVSAVADLVSRSAPVRLVIVGQGPEYEPLKELAAREAIADHVDFLGHVRRHVDVLSAVAGATVFASASEIEGFGIALVEAMALGVPYVVTDIPAFREVTAGGVGGRLFPPGDVAGLVAALEPLLDSEAERSRARQAGVVHAERYRWDAVAARTAEVLGELLETS